MIKTSDPRHSLNNKVDRKKGDDAKPNPKAVETRRAIEAIHEQRQLEQLFSL